MNTSRFLAFSVVLLSASTAAAQSARELFPNHQGNEWTYTGGLSGHQTRTVKVAARSGGWAKVEGWQGDHWWWMSGASGRIWVWNASTSRYSLVFDLGAAVGTPQRADADDLSCVGGATFELVDDDATVQTAVGTFNGCRILEFRQGPCVDAGLARVVFAPDVGIVEWSEQSIAGPVAWKLTRATVNGRSYTPQPQGFTGGFSASLAVDRPGYAPGDTLRLRFEVKNETAQTIPFWFNSGQTFDYVLRDGSGNEVYRWSRGRFFTMALRSVDMLPGEEWTFAHDIPLQDGNGAPLAAGRYTLEAYLTARPKVSLRIDVDVR